jgi:hypothetical protein
MPGVVGAGEWCGQGVGQRPRVVVLGVSKHLGGRAVLDDAALMQDHRCRHSAHLAHLEFSGAAEVQSSRNRKSCVHTGTTSAIFPIITVRPDNLAYKRRAEWT